ncbi:hypothetical protein [Aureliella helgolandensis]|uniref:Uncharacterized protein n=1 Tax=Aureliella helgolandensis TaxID=2527968 RepID=A0A518G2R7_9BACT|nr:hypothetical protein [Aureliella helgolandensis]QDV22882.1 hypothetical protein Q31a_11750 [Aureliella helgolandensis]
MTTTQEKHLPPGERDFWRLQAAVMTRGSAEWLELCELVKLAESCEATAHADRTTQWAREFAIPLIRELGRRLDRSNQSPARGETMRVVEIARDLRAAQLRELRENETAVSRRLQVKQLQQRLDAALENQSQLSLFGDGFDAQ